MTESAPAIKARARRIVHRTFGERQGPVTRLMSPSDLGRRLKPFVFLDLFDSAESSFSGFGWHPHSGIATLTYLWEGSVRYEDTTGAAGFLPRAAHGMAAVTATLAGHGDSSSGSPCRPTRSWGRPKASTKSRGRFARADVPPSFSATLAACRARSRRPPRSTIWPCGSRPVKPGAMSRRPITTLAGLRLPREDSLFLSPSRRASWSPSTRRTRRSTSEQRRTPNSFLGRPQAIPTNSPSDSTRCTRVGPRFKPANGASPR
jgi:Pirin